MAHSTVNLNSRDLLVQLERGRQQFHRAASRSQVAAVQGNLLAAMAWAQVAGHLAWSKHPGFYASRELENVLLEVANNLPSGSVPLTMPKAVGQAAGTHKPHILHVMTQAEPIGGHTRVVQRWVQQTTGQAVHSLITTDQRKPMPEWVVQAVEKSGGWALALGGVRQDLLTRARELRHASRAWADVVVLHVHPHDAVAIVAFGEAQGPPVILFNHADHVFWLGLSVADVVADIRESGQHITLGRRGHEASEILPIPIVKPDDRFDRAAARQQLGIADDEVMLLTIGSAYKYTPVGGLDFVATLTALLARNPNTILVAVGPSAEGAWAEANRLTGGRIRAVGAQRQLAVYHAAADIYLDPFPFASLTAMLEASQFGVPVVGVQNPDAPAFSGDDVALTGQGTACSSVDAYIKAVEELVKHSDVRREKGLQIKRAIEDEHLGPGWHARLERLFARMPSRHGVDKARLPVTDLNSGDLMLAAFHQLVGGEQGLRAALARHGRFLPLRDRMRLLWNGVAGKEFLPLQSYVGAESIAYARRALRLFRRP